MRKILLFVFFPLVCIFADSVKLYNDSAFELIAIIKSAQGQIIGQQTFAPGEQATWDTNQITTQLNVNYNASGSYTPFIVIWQCSNGGLYSSCASVSPGAIITANICSGPKYCKEKEKEQKDNCPPCPNVSSPLVQPQQNQNENQEQGSNNNQKSGEQNNQEEEKGQNTDLNNPDQNSTSFRR
jgi:hypothetical protein